jgi:HEAT repeat protein/Na+/melibiose symporter-like transporter
MTTELTNLDKIRRLPWQIAGNVLNNIFCVLTFFGSVFILFLNELHLDKTRIGFLLSLMPFCGLIALVAAPQVARFGFKKSFLIFWGLRKLAGALLLLTPYILARYGSNITFAWIAGVVFFFAICRAIAETAIYPWQQEFIPDYIRGKFGAVNNIICTLFTITAMFAASYVIGHYSGLGRFMAVIAAAFIAGAVSVWCFSFIPGGAPLQGSEAESANLRGMLECFKDRNFKRFMIGLALVSLGVVPLFSFIPLFMKEQVGLTSGNVVILDIATSIGSLISCYLWGWASDRYGSKPIMLSGLTLMIVLPFCWFFIPRHSDWSGTLAFVIAFFAGVGNMGWGTGFGRYLFVSAVPMEKRTAYMAVFYAWAGLIGGIGPLLAGRLLDLCQSFKGNFQVFTFDSYTPLFAISFLLLFTGLLLMNRIRADGAMPVRKFIGMFLQGNPFVALESLVRYGRARDEADRISMTERMGDAKNPLSSNELIEALGDPSFNVRFEAIISISRLPPDSKLIDALLVVLVGNEPDLSIAAAWALGKFGDPSAILPLRETLLSEFQLLHAHSARALARLGDVQSVPFFIERFRNEPNDKLRLAYAAALGTLQVKEVIPDLLGFLKTLDDPILRGEVALDLARIVGPERYYIQLWRATQVELGTSLAQAIFALEKEFSERKLIGGEVAALAGDCAARFAQNELLQAAALLSVLLRKFPAEIIPCPTDIIIRECAERLTEFGAAHLEYIILALHTLNEIVQNPSNHERT